MGSDLGRLTNDRHIDISDSEPCLAGQAHGVLDETARRDAPPLRVARREVLSDVPLACRAENGVDDRVERDVGVAMACEPAGMFNANAAKPQFLPLDQTVNVEARAGPWGAR